MTTRLGGNRCYRNLSSSAASGSTSRTSHLPRWSGLTILARAALPCPPVLAIPPLADAGLRRDVSGEPPHLFHWLRLRDGNAGRPWLLDPQQCHSRSEQRQVLHEVNHFVLLLVGVFDLPKGVHHRRHTREKRDHRQGAPF